MEKELEEFLKYIYHNCTDEYGNLQVCIEGDELDPTIENVVKQYLNERRNNLI